MKNKSDDIIVSTLEQVQVGICAEASQVPLIAESEYSLGRLQNFACGFYEHVRRQTQQKTLRNGEKYVYFGHLSIVS